MIAKMRKARESFEARVSALTDSEKKAECLKQIDALRKRADLNETWITETLTDYGFKAESDLVGNDQG